MIFDFPSSAAARIGQLGVILHWKAPDAEELREIGRMSDDFLAATGDGMSLLVVVEAGAGLLDSAARAEMERQYRARGNAIAATAQVIEETGFSGATIRSVFQAALLFSGRRTEHKIFADVDHALVWLGRVHPGNPDPDDVRALVAELRARRPT